MVIRRFLGLLEVVSRKKVVYDVKGKKQTNGST